MLKLTLIWLSLALTLNLGFLQKIKAASIDWSMQPYDLKRSLPNNNKPPQRLEPRNQLSPLSPQEVGAIRSVNLDKEEKVIALTFDLCELATSTSGCDLNILGFLHQEQLPATLFMGGKWMRTHATRAKQLIADPLFEIGNHAWSHANCTKLSPQGLRAQVLWTQAQYELLREEILQEQQNQGISKDNIPKVPLFFRPPYALCNLAELKAIAKMGLQVALWNVVCEIGPLKSQAQAKNRAKLIVKQVKPGSILLFHANLVPVGSDLLVKEMVSLLRQEGY
ncbi:MAG: polysaccharide deacetylase family protein, partial [Desulfovibrionaceae bacterium]|nr:polysaccharide deacetylase family protein [Desulfovibrionaceae bacterium]